MRGLRQSVASIPGGVVSQLPHFLVDLVGRELLFGQYGDAGAPCYTKANATLTITERQWQEME